MTSRSSILSGFPKLSQFPFVVADTEDTGLRWWEDKMFGFSLAVPDGKGGLEGAYWDVRSQPNALQWLKDELHTAGRLVFHHAKFDLHMLREAGVRLSGSQPVTCTMVRAALLNEHEYRYDLDYLGLEHLGVGKDVTAYDKMAKLFGGKATKHAQAGNLHRAPEELVRPYAIQDVLTTGLLYLQQDPRIKEEDLTLVDSIEERLLWALLDCEHRGVRVDVGAAESAVKQLTKIINHGQRELNELAGFPVNPNPSGSIHQLFDPKRMGDGWVLSDGTMARNTGAGKASIDAACLRAMRHPAAKLILDLRKNTKVRDTFIVGHVLGHQHKGYIHAHFNQTKTESGDDGSDTVGVGPGRLSVTDPALQQIHKRDPELAPIVRSLFLPDPGQVWNCRDWSQMDFRVFAHYTKDPKLLAMYAKDPDTDFHAMVAEITGLPRNARYAGDGANAKQINLGLVFGMGQGKLASQMGLPYTKEKIKFRGENVEREVLRPGPEAKDVFLRYHTAIPGVKEILDSAASKAQSVGFVRTMLRRRIRFPGKKFTHKAGGLVFQGTAADALKVKLVETYDYYKGTEARMMLNVHDEINSSLPKGAKGKRLSLGHGELYERFDGVVTPMKFRVPIRSSVGEGPNWWIACKED